jgi:hypothetical protein
VVSILVMHSLAGIAVYEMQGRRGLVLTACALVGRSSFVF